MIKPWKYGYSASDDGKVYSKEGGVLKTHISGKNVSITIYGDHRISTVSVGRVIAETFVPNDNPEVKTVVVHIDGDRFNNRAENLQWVSKRVACLTRYNKE